MIEKITDQNLEKYDSRLKEWCDRKFFEKGNYGKYQTTEESGVITFYPAPNTPLEGKVKFSFKETMPANGDKGPDNPSVITGISSIDIKLTNKNLISLPYHTVNKTSNGITWTINSDNTITADGTATAGSTFYCTGIGIGPTSIGSHELVIKPNTNYFLSGCPANGSATTYKMYASYGTGANYHSFQDTGNGCVFNVPQNFNKGIIIRCSVESGTTVENLVFRPQLEEGTEKTNWEVINREKTTISLGNTYYGGEIDLATGVMTVKSQKVTLDENCIYTFFADPVTTTDTRIAIIVTIPTLVSSDMIKAIRDISSCDSFPFIRPADADSSAEFIMFGNEYQYIQYKQIRIYVLRSTIGVSSSATAAEINDAAKSWFTSHPATFVIGFDEPYWTTIQLDPIEINSLAQFDKYTPRLNTVYTDADSVQISYLKSPIRDEYEKTQAILSLGGNS